MGWQTRGASWVCLIVDSYKMDRNALGWGELTQYIFCNCSSETWHCKSCLTLMKFVNVFFLILYLAECGDVILLERAKDRLQHCVILARQYYWVCYFHCAQGNFTWSAKIPCLSRSTCVFTSCKDCKYLACSCSSSLNFLFLVRGPPHFWERNI